MSVIDDYESYDAVGLAKRVADREVSAEELLDAAISRVEAENPRLNAVVTRMYDQARNEIAAGLPDGPLKGVPFLLKDLGLFTRGVPTSFGCRLFADYVPDHDSTLVQRYRKAGLVFFGKTNTPEFGLTVTTESVLLGPCRNPWDPERTAGGSSGGSAAAVAAGMVPAAHASDGGGSIRIPASCCGLFGLKPTRGRIPAGPDVGEGWNGMSIDHVITRSVRDSAVLLDVAAGPSAGDPYWAPPQARPYREEIEKDPGKLRIAFTVTPPSGIAVHPDCIAAVRHAAQLCTNLGHSVEETAPDFEYEPFRRATVVIINANLSAALAQRTDELGRDLSPEDVEHITWLSAEGGKAATSAEYVAAVRTIHRTGRTLAGFMEDYDVLLSPVLLQPPLPLGELDTTSTDTRNYLKRLYGFFGFTNLFNATGQPSMSVPLYWNSDNLPIGLLFSARFGDEATLFRLAAQLESAQPWFDRRPPK